jgi:hypothetical protein
MKLFSFLIGCLGLLILSSSAPAQSANTFDATITWTCTCSNQTGFNIYRKTGTTGTYAKVGSTAATVMTFTDPGLLPSTTYVYNIGAFNPTNEVHGAETTATTGGGGVTGAPGAPTVIFTYKP